MSKKRAKIKSVIWGPPKVEGPWQLPKLPYLNPGFFLPKRFIFLFSFRFFSFQAYIVSFPFQRNIVSFRFMNLKFIFRSVSFRFRKLCVSCVSLHFLRFVPFRFVSFLNPGYKYIFIEKYFQTKISDEAKLTTNFMIRHPYHPA
jgi:hypothetical protein